MDTHRVVFNSHEEAADAWLGGDSPWVRRIIGITPAPRVGSLYNEGIWDSDAAVWRGKDVLRTTESDHAQRTSFLLGTPSLKAAGCSVEPVVVIVRCRVVMCILHCCMAMGRLQMTNIERLAAERLAGGDEVSRAAIQAVLHEHRTGCRLGKGCSPDGEETSRLFAAWPDVALLLSVGPEEPLYRAVMGMAKLLKDLYHTYQVGTRPQCRAAAAAFREHSAPRSASHYILFLEEDADRVLDDIWPFGLAMFSNDIVESLNRFLKQAFNEHSARGGGRQTATGTASYGRSQASIDSDADALRQVLQWVSLYLHIHLHQHDVVPHVPCVPRAALETTPSAPPPFLSSLLSSAPINGRARQRRYDANDVGASEGHQEYSGLQMGSGLGAGLGSGAGLGLGGGLGLGLGLGLGVGLGLGLGWGLGVGLGAGFALGLGLGLGLGVCFGALCAQWKSVRWVCVSCVLPCSPCSPCVPFALCPPRNLMNVDGKGKTREPPGYCACPMPIKGLGSFVVDGKGKTQEPPGHCACPMPIKGLGSFVVDGKGKTREPPGHCACPMPIKGLGSFVVVDAPPPPHGAVVHAVRPVRARNCVYFPLFRRRSNNLFWQRSSGHWNVARTSPEQVVGTSPEQGVWVGLASLAHRDRGPGGSTGCTTPASPIGGTGGHALRATQQLCAGFASPSPTSWCSQASSVGNPRSRATGAATACPTRGRASRASPSASPPVARALDWELNE